MSNLRFFSPPPLQVGRVINLSENAATHATKVLRLKIGDSLTLFCGDGFDYSATLLSLEKKSVTARMDARTKIDNESPLNIQLLQGISSGDRMDVTIQKAVELGVREIFPINTERSVVKLNAERAEKRMEHWQGVAIAACEQSRRAFVPTIHVPQTLGQWLSEHDVAQDLNILLNPIGAKKMAQLSKPNGKIHLLIGPEGGLSANEIALASQHQFQSVVLGPRILRTETAALTAIASMQTVWGDF